MLHVVDYLDIAAELAAKFPTVEDAYQIAALEICEQAAKRPNMPPTEFRPHAAKCATDRLRNARKRRGYEVANRLAGGAFLPLEDYNDYHRLTGDDAATTMDDLSGDVDERYAGRKRRRTTRMPPRTVAGDGQGEVA